MRFNYVENRDGTITIDEIQGTGDILSIPSFINNHPVTTISVRACKIPALKELYIPKTITDIHGGAFYLCTNLEKIVVEKGNPVYDSRNNCNAIIETLSDKLVFGCKNTVIPLGIKIIELSAFKDQTNLKTINIPESVTRIKHAAFMGCRRLKELHLPKSIKCIESYAFMNCGNLSKVTFDPDIALFEIDTETFAACAFKEISLPKRIRTIKSGAFEKCTRLENIVLNDGLDNICGYAFENCVSLKELKIPDSVTTIGRWVCRGCEDLEAVYFGSGIEAYEPGTFTECKNVNTFGFANDFKFIVEELMYNNKLKRIITPYNVCRFTSLVILDYAERNKRIDMLEDKYMDNMDEDEFDIFIDRTIKDNWPQGANKYIEFYNRKFGGPNRLQI